MPLDASGAPPPGDGAPAARTPFPIGWLGLTLVSLLAALLAGDLLVYRRLIAPRLMEVGAVPGWWWVGVVGPPITVMLLSGARLRSWRHVAAFAWAASALSVAFDYLRVVAWPPPGAGDQHLAASAPLFFWVVGLVVRWIAFGLVLAAGAAAGALARRPGPPRLPPLA